MFFSFHGSLHAEDTIVPKIQETLSVIVNPEIPGPNQNVSISIQSFAFDLNTSKIVWVVNDVIEDTGTGIRDFSFKTGDIGTISHVKVVITPKNKPAFQKEIFFSIGEVNLVWQARTYTPEFYEGKALFSDEASLIIAAIPNFLDTQKRPIPADTLIYTWKANNTILDSKSGYGKNVLIYFGAFLGGKENIEVEVSNQDKSIRAISKLILEPSNPSLLIYENHPLYGILYNRAIGGEFNLRDREVSLTAAPYFFSTDGNYSNNIFFNWKINNTPANTTNGNTITLRQDSEESGKSLINLEASHLTKKFQLAKKDFLLNFGNNRE